ncbi:MAG: ATP-binding protein [Anaerolineae bacterium]
MSQEVYQQTSGAFRYERIALRDAPGEPTQTHESWEYVLLGRRHLTGKGRGIVGVHVPLVGRQRALRLLLSTWDAVEIQGEGRIAIVSGEAGVGKTRLVNEFLASVQDGDGQVYQGSCVTYARAKPLHLIADLLRDILGVSDTDTMAVKRDALRGLLERLDIPEEQSLPYLSSVLGLSFVPGVLGSHIGHLDDAALQKMTHAALRRLIMGLVARQPTVLVFEDLHWVDPASLTALRYLVKTLADAPVMFVLISRDSELGNVIQPLLDTAVTLSNAPVDIHLAPLSRTDCEELVMCLIPQIKGDAKGLRSVVVERSEGNPFYAEEIVRMLLDRGALQRRDGNWIVMPEAMTVACEVPPTLSGLMLARMDTLTHKMRRTLQIASVINSHIAVSLLSTLVDLDVRETEAMLMRLLEQGFLIQEAGQGVGAEDQFAFRHALVQETVYNTLITRDQQQLHGLVARAIEAGPDTDSPDVMESLAYHYSASAEPERAVPYLLGAAEFAARRCAYQDAITHYRKVLDERVVGALQQKDLLQAQIGLGRALKFVGEYAESKELLESTLETALYSSLSSNMLLVMVKGLRELADIRQMEGDSEEAYEFLVSGLNAIQAEGQDKNSELWRSVVERLSWIRFRQGRLDEAFELASAATLDVDQDHENDPLTLASLYNTLGGISWQKGNLQQAAEYVSQSLQLYDKMQYAWGMANAYANLGVLHFTLGAWPQANQELARAERLWFQIGDVHQRAVTLNNLGILRQAMGQLDSAKADLTASLELFADTGETWGRGRAHTSLARLALSAGDQQEAARHIQRAETLFEEIEHVEVELEWMKASLLGPVNPAQAVEVAERGLELARERHQTEEEVNCLRILGEIKGQVGQHLEAESLLRESMDLCLQTNMPYEFGLALSAMGRLYVAVSQKQQANQEQWLDRAREMVQRAVEQFEKLGAAVELDRAQDALTALRTMHQPEASATMTAAVAKPKGSRLSYKGGIHDVPEGEIRPVSVVWISSVPEDDASEEAIFETLAEVVSSVGSVAERYQGKMIQQQRGLMLVFGAVQVLEDDLERAVLAAWHLNTRFCRDNSPVSGVLRLSIGIDTGNAITGRIGSRFHTEFIVQGGPVETSRELATRVPPGQVWATPAARWATERIADYESVELHDVQGAQEGRDVPADRTEAWRLTGLLEQPEAPRGIRGLRARMIGREGVLREMLRLSRGLSDGVGALIWIEGEPGIGKSRLMTEYGSAMTSGGVQVWRGQCTSQSSSRIFSLFSDLLMQVFSLRPSDSPEVISARLESAFAAWPDAMQSTRPYLEVVLGVWPSGLLGERLAKLEPEQLRQQIFVSMRRFIKQLARQSPCVILLDDLHWIDPISAELLNFLLTIVVSEPIVFVCAQRRQGGDAPNDRLVRAQSLIPDLTLRLTLDRLSESDRDLLLNELLPEVEIPEEIRKVILEQSDGNPYFIEEYLRAMLDQGHLARYQGRWQLRGGLQSADVEVPASLEMLLRSRVDALPPELREVMQVAAVIGSPFEADVLHAALDIPTSTTSLDRLASRLLVRRGRDLDRWEFHHPLIGGVVYKGLLEARRQQLHRRVALVLESRQREGSDDQAEILAFQLMRAGMGAQALSYLISAGERALRRFANEAAIEHLEAGAETLSTLPDVEDSTRWRLAAALGDAYRAMGRHQDSMAVLRAGLALTQTGMLGATPRAGLYRRLGETARKQGGYADALRYYNAATLILKDTEVQEGLVELARTHLGIAWVHFHQGAPAKALEAVGACLEGAEAADAIAELAAAENLLGGIHYRQSKWHAAERHTRRAMVLREQMGYTWGVAGTLSNLGVLAVLEGDWHKARSFFERSLALREEMDDAEGLALLLNNLGNLSRDQGELAEAEAFFRRSLQTLRPFARSYHFANASGGLASVFCLQGQLDLARETLAPALKLAADIGAEELLVDGYRWEVEILAREHMYRPALTMAEKALEKARDLGNQGAMATLWRLMSELKLQQGDIDQARDLLTSAQDVSASVTDMLERGRVHAHAARIAISERDWASAEPDLRAAQRIFLQLGAKLDIDSLRQIAGERYPG